MTAKSIWIELDSLHSSILLKAINEGLMPNLAGLMDRGGATRVEYEVPFQVSAWATAHTGLSVINHGIVAFDQRIPGTYRMRIQKQLRPFGAAYWDMLGEHGKRVLVINNVNSIRSPSVNGIQLNYWLPASNHWLLPNKPKSFPPEIAMTLEHKFPVNSFVAEDIGSSNFVDAERLVSAISSNLDRKSRGCAELIASETWDHIHVGFDDLHNLGHVLWDCFEEDSPRNALIRQALSDTDAAVGIILDRAGPEAAVLVLLLGGIGPANTWSHMVDTIIGRFEHGESGDHDVYRLLGRAWSAQPPWLKSRFFSLKTHLREFYLGAKRRRRRAFAMPLNEESGAIRINLRGREPDGIVEPGEEYNALVEELRDALLELRDLESGISLVSDILLSRDLVAARDSILIPDLFVCWNRIKQMKSVESKRLGRIDIGFWPARTGDHHVDGLLLLNLPLVQDSQKGVSVLDLAPTVSALHGVRHELWRGSSFIEPNG